MAGDWIKMRVDLDGDPAVISTAAKVGKETLWVVGALHRFWSWADQQTRNGNAPGVTKSWLDAHVGAQGFAQALCDSGWLMVDSAGMTIPKFEKHNGNPGKQRALTQKRVKRYRNAKDNALSVTPSSLISVSSSSSDLDGGMQRGKVGREAISGIEATGVRDALRALDAWSERSRGTVLNAVRGEPQAVVLAVGAAIAMATPIVHGGRSEPRALLVPKAAEALEAEGCEFKSIKWVLKCIENKLNDWADRGVQEKSNGRSSNGVADPTERRTAKSAREFAEGDIKPRVIRFTGG